MATRLWTALLMLAAVFAMHGVQCAGGVDSASPAATTPDSATAAHSGSVAMTALAPGQSPSAMEAADVADSSSASATATAPLAAAAGPVDAGHDSAPHDWAAHLWTACLAVLAAALAVLLALLVRRLVQLTAPVLQSARARAAGRLAPLRPPDLSALCLLRI